MAEVTNALIYEVLKSVQERMGKMDDKMDEATGELTAIRGYLRGVHQDIGNIYATLAKQSVGLERIENRLELREPEPA